MRTHLKIHTGEKPNKCNQCGFASVRAYHLRRHLKTHLKINTGDQLKVSARIRYRQNLQSATLLKTSSGLFVEFQKSQFAITPGQFVAWYLKDELLGSGVIS